MSSRFKMLNVEDDAHKAVASGLEQSEIQKGNISILACIDPLQNIRIMVREQIVLSVQLSEVTAVPAVLLMCNIKERVLWVFLFFVEDCC